MPSERDEWTRDALSPGRDLRVAIAAPSKLAADAGAEVADRGGNAVDAAVAAATVCMCTELGLMAPGCGGFATVWPAGADPVTVDGYCEVPGRQGGPTPQERSTWEAVFDYGGEMRSMVGYGTVATPGVFAGYAEAIESYGCLPWREIVGPAIRWARRGFPLPPGAAQYLAFTHKAIFSWHPESSRVLHHDDGSPLREGEWVHIPGLADSLALIAEAGVGALYGGELGQRIAAHVQDHGGSLGLADLAAYRAVTRTPVRVRLGDWEVATNPPPAVGGACLGAMLLLLNTQPSADLDETQMARIQRAVLDYRAQRLDGAHGEVSGEAQTLLNRAAHGYPGALLGAPSTMHISSVDSDGLGCSITASAGYGSGVNVPGTGFWLNNSLGEIDLHPRGLHGLAPGARLASNMAPTVARRADGAVIAIGSAGASRITTAIAQVLANHVQGAMTLSEAVDRPRLHVELTDSPGRIACEPGVEIDTVDGMIPRPFDRRNMYFGGAQVARFSPTEGLQAVADPRRGGHVAFGGTGKHAGQP